MKVCVKVLEKQGKNNVNDLLNNSKWRLFGGVQTNATTAGNNAAIEFEVRLKEKRTVRADTGTRTRTREGKLVF